MTLKEDQRTKVNTQEFTGDTKCLYVKNVDLRGQGRFAKECQEFGGRAEGLWACV